MSGPLVRVAGPDDWATWRDLRLRALQDSPSAFGSTYERERAFDEATWRERMRGHDGVSVLAWLDGTAVGMGGGFQDLPGFLHVVAMWTDPAYRRRGLSILVLDVVVDRALAAGRRVVLDVARGNPAARRAYERSGFTPTGESEPLRDGSDSPVGVKP